jgi:anion-transporting  ArsA/GET3 family ATPase
VRSILDNELVRRFLDFVPGSQELVTVSAIVDLLDKYDVVVVDLPASGHAFSMLDITRSALGLFRGGPIRKRVVELRRALADARTRMLIVALPEEMVVNETLETADRMQRYDLTGGTSIVLLNRAIPPSLTAGEGVLLDRLSSLPLSGAAAELVAAGRWERSLEQAAAEAIERLTEALERAPITVPPVPSAGNPRAAVRLAAIELGRQLGVGPRELTWT